MKTRELEAIVGRAMRDALQSWETRTWHVVDALRSAGVVAHMTHGPCPKGWGLCACNEDWAPVVTTRDGTETYPRSDRGHVFDGCCCDPTCQRWCVSGADNFCNIHDG